MLNLSYEDIQKLNKALKRNLENQSQTTPQPTKQIENNTDSELMRQQKTILAGIEENQE